MRVARRHLGVPIICDGEAVTTRKDVSSEPRTTVDHSTYRDLGHQCTYYPRYYHDALTLAHQRPDMRRGAVKLYHRLEEPESPWSLGGWVIIFEG
jgi:hypothetical protein